MVFLLSLVTISALATTVITEPRLEALLLTKRTSEHTIGLFCLLDSLGSSHLAFALALFKLRVRIDRHGAVIRAKTW